MAEELTVKQRRFVEEYCIDWNGTRAAIAAGYSEDTAAVIASENLIKPNIRKAIDERLDLLSMSAAEATKRLSEWGRGSFEPFMSEDEQFGLVLDLKKPTAKPNIHLLKKVKQTKRVKKTVKIIDGEPVTDTETEYYTEIEIHDAKDAVVQIGRIRGLFKDEQTGKVEVIVTRKKKSITPNESDPD